MEKIIEDKWDQALDALAIPEDRNGSLAMATQVFLTSMDLSKKDPEHVRGSLSVLLRRGLGRWAGNWMLDAFRKDFFESIVPRLQELESDYMGRVDTEPTHSVSANWVVIAFTSTIDVIHARFARARNMAVLFDERVREMSKNNPQEGSSLEISSRFLTQFSAELETRLTPAIKGVASFYFETIFRRYESAQEDKQETTQEDQDPGSDGGDSSARDGGDFEHEDLIEKAIMKSRLEQRARGSYGVQHTYQSTSNPQPHQQPHLDKTRSRVMQDGRFAMDLFVDDVDEGIVEQIFQGHHGAAASTASTAPGVRSLLKGQASVMGPHLELWQQLEDIGGAAHFADDVMRMLYGELEQKILESYKGKWDVPTLESGKDWVSRVVLPFLRWTLLPKKDQESPSSGKRYKMWASRLEHGFFFLFGKLRMDEAFDIIVEFPESAPAVLDLKACLQWSHQHQQLLSAMYGAIEKRLLHPGAETTAIIEFYICTIQCLRIIDPSGVMLDHTAQKINQYLRTRDDTMRAIVSCIVDDSNNLLNNTAEGIRANNVDLNEEESDDDTWVPEPVNAGPDLSSARRRMADIISVLANIYNTNDLFIKEFQATLADRLLQAKDFNIDREVRQLELLKLRFGEMDLQNCEVMLADVAESKRVNANIQSLSHALPVSATIASRYYWPKMEDEALELPSAFKKLIDAFGAAFRTFKPAQKLHVFPSLGLVDLELELEDRTLQFQVPPVHAAMIHLFEEQDTWTLPDIAAKLKVEEDTLEQKVQYWVEEGVLKETARFQYQLIENLSE